MISDSLILAIPDVVAFLRRDGVITHHLGGRRIPLQRHAGSLAGRPLDEAIDGHAAAVVGRLARRAFTTRNECDAQFSVDEIHYEARISPQGPQRALCIIRQINDVASSQETRRGGEAAQGTERRGFVRRLQEYVA